MKKLLSILLTAVLAFGLSGISEAKTSSGSFSGGSKSSFSSGSTNHSYGSTGNSSSSTGSYSSGQKRPSSNITQKPNTPNSQPYQQPKSSWFGGIGHFLGGMAAGALISSMFSHMLHPFGGFGTGFSFFGLLFDALLLFVGYKLIRRFMFR